MNYINKEKLINSLQLGVNEKLRGKIWVLLSCCLHLAVNHSENFYYKLIESEEKEIEDTINKDIERTIIYSYNSQLKNVSQIDINSNKKKLFNILKAYAIYDPDVSYVQGTNYVVAVLLNSMNSERASFWTFVKLMSKWREIYTKDTPRLIKMLNNLEKIFETSLPQLYQYFDKIDFLQYFAAVFTQYFVTLFSYNCPIEYANRVIDFFWIYEEKIIYDCIIHIFDLQKFILMQMDIDQLVPYIRDKIVTDCMNSWGLQGALPFGIDII